MKKQDLRENKAITLIALVITIIVLLILAAVTLNVVIGQNGILNKADKAKKAQSESAILEDTNLAILGEQSDYYSANKSDKTLKEFLEEKFDGNYKTSSDATLSYNGEDLIKYAREDQTTLIKVDDDFKLSIIQEIEDGDNKYSANKDGTYTIIEIPEKQTEITIPSEINGVEVTAIGGNFAKDSRTTLTKITMPDTIKVIGNRAFYGCTKVTEIHFSNVLEKIGSEAFRGCGNSATKLELPETLMYIGKDAFASYGSKNTTEVYLGKNVNDMQSGALAIFTLQSISVSEENSKFKAVDGVLYTKSQKTLIQYPAAKSDKTSFSVPSGVTTIGQYAFYKNKSIVDVTLPETVNRIAKYAFESTKLTNINIPSGVKKIEKGVFASTGITQLNLANIEEIEDEAFSSSNLQSITIPKVRIIGKNVFYGTKFTTLNMAESMPNVTKIGESAFENSTLKQINISNATIEIGEKAFNNTSITEIVLPENIKTIGKYAFEGCSNLTKATIKANITAISEGMFKGCNVLNSVVFISNITTFEKEAFYNCEALTLTLPDTLTTVKEKSVYGPSITNVPDSLKNIEDDSFGTNIPEDLKAKILAINPNGIADYIRDSNDGGDVGVRFPTISYLYEEQ